MKTAAEAKPHPGVSALFWFLVLSGPVFYTTTSLHFQWEAIKEIRDTLRTGCPQNSVHVGQYLGNDGQFHWPKGARK